tara:strand:- start:53 stop:403 length:351 start_codon:yes stop_codon:yes gene_type:complete
MRANERLRNVIKIGYLETPFNTARVQPELNPINIDTTNYKDESFADSYKRNQREAAEDRRTKELFKEFSQEHKTDNVAGFWESYLHGIGVVFKLMGKVAIFAIGFFVTIWLWNMIF